MAHRNIPGKGKVKIGKFSGLRKLMRAARRGLIPSERMFIIQTAERKAASRLLRRMSRKTEAVWSNGKDIRL
jgi:hypothetical protein